jgi:nicotinate-nucleotide pyrophosphorylase (carboxylating)
LADRLIKLALEEDLGTAGDLTCQAVIPEGMQGRACFVVRKAGVIAGLPMISRVFAAVEPRLNIEVTAQDGEKVIPNTRLATLTGPLRGILMGERTALNFLQRLSGVATQTFQFAEQLKGTTCRLLDTRKTTPGWRILEKYAVRCGGGHNHRMGLFDAVMIKDNHLAGLRHEGTPLHTAIQQARSKVQKKTIIEVEVEHLDQLREALSAAPDIVLLDNMKPDLLRAAVQMRNELAPEVKLEASGGITLNNIRAVAATGVDCISVGALTHSAVALDIALDYLD